jgi:hypothetical protein
MVELKIINTKDFEELAAPLAEHRIRTAMYLELIENSLHPHRDKVDTSVGSVLYVSRGHGKKHPEYNKVLPFKEFLVERDDAALTPYFARAAEVQSYVKGGSIPARPKACDTSFCKMANNCPLQGKCWKMG